MSVRALLLDADGVTQETHSDFRASLKALCSDESRADDFVAEVFAAERPCATGGDFAVALGAVLEAWGSSYSVDAALECWERVEPNAAVLGFVAELRAHGTLVALATNQQNRRAAYMRETLRYDGYFDALLISCELGHAKPNVDYFMAPGHRPG